MNKYINIFSGRSELWNHMQIKHFTCEVSGCSCAFKTKKQLDVS